jgi:hypothetical protein
MLAGDVVDAICSGVWGIDDQGSVRLTDDEDRCVVERKTLGRNARVRETKWWKIDMVLLVDDDATVTRRVAMRSYCSHVLVPPAAFCPSILPLHRVRYAVVSYLNQDNPTGNVPVEGTFYAEQCCAH